MYLGGLGYNKDTSEETIAEILSLKGQYFGYKLWNN